jgi:hypothetical protein
MRSVTRPQAGPGTNGFTATSGGKIKGQVLKAVTIAVVDFTASYD